MRPRRFPHEPVFDDLQVAPPYCDLWVQEIMTKADHDNRLLNVGAVIANRGQAPPSGPIRIHTKVLWDLLNAEFGWVQESVAEWQWYPPTIGLPYRTEVWATAPLHYAEEGGGGYYITVTVGDEDNHAGDSNPNNNSKTIESGPYHKRPIFNAEMQQRLRQETTMGRDGKYTSKLTLGGKPIKK